MLWGCCYHVCCKYCNKKSIHKYQSRLTMCVCVCASVISLSQSLLCTLYLWYVFLIVTPTVTILCSILNTLINWSFEKQVVVWEQVEIVCYTVQKANYSCLVLCISLFSGSVCVCLTVLFLFKQWMYLELTQYCSCFEVWVCVCIMHRVCVFVYMFCERSSFPFANYAKSHTFINESINKV